MKLITAIIREVQLDKVRESLIEAGINRITVSMVSGNGRQRIEEMYRGLTVVPDLIPKMAPPYVLRTIQGPEISMFRPESVEEVFKGGGSFPLKVSLNSNRTGIRLEGYRLEFVDGVETSIVSEALLPGVIQVPGDGHPIIVLKERTVGGYARIAHVIKADQWILGQLKPGDTVGFGMVDMGTAEMLYKDMIKALFEGIITREGG